ncbi:hypothetical protein [Gilliamella sp. Pas-s27]|uniref:hypothetical protein n=1 Tax=Gilliamella sp. Pas-s27 TaxID=2687311 RepID=UPI0013659C95|nr:hypothetical protein [Gilliamella sp. Pas-s27]MWP47994.1 hypothetical protein [Gilliamella sp. Pas-s27]
MKRRLFIIFCYFITIYADAKVDNDLDKKITINKIRTYQGDNFVSKKNYVKKIDSTCVLVKPYESGRTQKEIDKEREKCILSKITFDYSEIINQMALNEKVYLPPINGINVYLEKVKEIDPSSLETVTTAEVKLFTEINDQISDSLTIYYIKNDYDAFYVESQYYYIDNFIYILKYGSDEDGSLVRFWKKYSISSNGKFKLEDLFECHFDNNFDKNICK